MAKKVIFTDKAPKAIGPYSQAIEANGMVFCSGQIPVDPKTSEIVAGGVEEQTQQVMKNMSAVLEAAGLGLQNVVKTTIFLKDMGSFGTVNRIYGEYFTENPPARATVEVARLPKDVLVEIECIAVR